ncbi:MAG: hypothetical protein KDI06_20270, partial [Calditrichaeota bacterium]|nr:hypothetical protein [Calditrichota bacterium]
MKALCGKATLLWLMLLSALLPAREQEILVRFKNPAGIRALSNGAAPFASSLPALDALFKSDPPHSIRPFFEDRAAPPGLEEIYLFAYPDSLSSASALGGLLQLPDIRYAAFNTRMRVFQSGNDPDLDRQYYLENIRALSAWEIETGDPSVIVGVIDTGVDYLHEDLQGQLWINTAEDLNGNGMLDSLDNNG